MLIDVQSILKTDGEKLPLSGKLLVPDEFKNAEIVFHDDLSFSGVVQNIGGVLELAVSAEGTFSVPCSRCTKPTEQKFSVSLTETVTDAKHDETESEDDETILLVGTCIDLDSIIWPEIFLALESKYLCSPDCKGLCIHCGTDLNVSSCDCKEDDIDPRLAGLAKLLQ